MQYFDGLYTLLEIAINNNFGEKQLADLNYMLNKKDIDEIKKKFPELTVFIPHCRWYKIKGRNYLAMPAYIYDTYTETQMLPNTEIYDINPDPKKLEPWEYIPPIVFEIQPQEGFEFTQRFFENDIWKLFLSGSARMDHYKGTRTELEERVKYAIVEYMMRRPQFYSDEDFVDNPILHKKYGEAENVGDNLRV